MANKRESGRNIFLIISWAVVSIVIAVVLFSPYRARLTVGADFFLQDRALGWMPSPEPLDEVVFLGIDEASLNVFEDDPDVIASERALTLMAEPFPWSREFWGLAIERLVDAGAKLVVLDLVIRGEREGDEKLKEVLTRVGDKVILGCSIDYPGGFQANVDTASMTLPPLSILPENEDSLLGIGYVNFWTDFDGLVRRVFLYTTLQGAKLDATVDQASHRDAKVWYSMTSEVVQKLELASQMENDSGMWQIPMMPNIGEVYPVISLYELFWPSIWEQNFASGGFFKDKIVMIGPAALIQQDLHPTPIGTMAGPLLHLNSFTAAIRGGLFQRASDLTNILVVSLVGLFLIAILTRIQMPVLTMLILLLVTAAFLGGAAYIYSEHHILLSLGGPLLSLGLLGSIVLSRDFILVWQERQLLRQSLEQRVSPEIMAEIMASPDGYLNQVGGVRKNVSILFSDVRGFTSLSENMEPEQLVAQLNEYLDAMVGAILSNKGMVDKFIGDAVMAVWGGIPDMDAVSSSEYSVQAGCLMRAELERMNQKWKERGIAGLRMGIGVNRGVSIVGNIGSERRLEFTVIGDSVNLAARLESLTKQYGIDFAISETVALDLDGTWRLRTLDRIRVVGKKEPVTIYEVIGKEGGAEELDDEFWAWCQDFTKVFELYQKRDFEQAALRFDELLKRRPSDLSAKKMAERCHLFVTDPPPEDWQGCVSLEKK